MICEQCGTANSSTSRFCRQCGSVIKKTTGSLQYTSAIPASGANYLSVSLREDLKEKLEEFYPKNGEAFCFLHLMGQNYPIGEFHQLHRLLEEEWILKNDPAYDPISGRWFEASMFPGIKKSTRSMTIDPSLSGTSHEESEELLVAAKKGKEAEEYASRGDFLRAIAIYQELVDSNVRYPLVKKRLFELKEMKDSSQEPTEIGNSLVSGEIASDPSLPWIPFYEKKTQPAELPPEVIESAKSHGMLDAATEENSQPKSFQPGPVSAFFEPQRPSPQRIETEKVPEPPKKSGTFALSVNDLLDNEDEEEKTNPIDEKPEEEATSTDDSNYLASGKVPFQPQKNVAHHFEKLRNPNNSREESAPITDKYGDYGIPTTMSPLPDFWEKKESFVPTQQEVQVDPPSNNAKKNNDLHSFDELTELSNPKVALPALMLQSVSKTKTELNLSELSSATVTLQETVAESRIWKKKLWISSNHLSSIIDFYEYPSLEWKAQIELSHSCKYFAIAGDYLLILQNQSSSLQLYSLESLKKQEEFYVGVQPIAVEVIYNRYVVVADRASASLYFLDLQEKNTLQNIKVAAQPYRLFFEESEQLLFVFHRDQKLLTKISFSS